MRIRRLVAAGVVVALVGGGYAAYAAQGDAPSYRTATATVGDVEQTLALTGTVEPAGRADLSFATSGTVASVDVSAGETVEAGQVLARLDAADLRRAVTRARSTLAAARAQLEADREGQASAVEQVTASAPTADTVAYRTVSADEQDDPLEELQQAVIDAQSVVSDALVVASDALAAQQAACTAATVGEQACADALTAVQTAQQQVSDDQATLQAAIDALASFLQDVEQPQPEQPTEQPTEQPEPQQPGVPQPEVQQPEVQQPEAPLQPEQEQESPTASAATLAQDQAEIDQAEADLVAARQELAMATMTAPFGGRVVSVDTTRGASVASGTAVLVLVSQGTTTVQATATSTQVRGLEIGQQTTATVVGTARELTGTVTQISSQPDDSSAYPVTITLDRKRLHLATGLTATVSVVTGTAEDVVTVPASAVSDGAVQVVIDGVANRVPVTTGATGETTVEVAEGLEEGDVVVLADLDRALPTSDTPGESGFPGGGGEVRMPPSIDVPRGA